MLDLQRKNAAGMTLELCLNVYAKKVREGAAGWNFDKLLVSTEANFGVSIAELAEVMKSRKHWREALAAIPNDSVWAYLKPAEAVTTSPEAVTP